MNIITGAVSQGLIWAIMVMGVYISYRILDFADLTADGSIALGGSVAAVLISNGLNPFVALILSFLAGVLSGSVTGLLNAKFGIPGILAGILTMISLYSVNIEILGRANISLLGANTCFSIANDIFGVSYNVSAIILSVVISLFIVVALRWFLMTEIGQLVRATGDNESMVRAMGKNPRKYKILSLAISNGLIALSGGLIAQNQGYADVAMGTGSIIIGLASIIIGEVIFGKKSSFVYKFISIILGSIIYRLVIAFVLYMGIKPTMLNLLTASVVACALAFPAVKKNINYKGVRLSCLQSKMLLRLSMKVLKTKNEY